MTAMNRNMLPHAVVAGGAGAKAKTATSTRAGTDMGMASACAGPFGTWHTSSTSTTSRSTSWQES